MKIIKRKNLYYLAHSIRSNQNIKYREKYLGKAIPENIEIIKEMFLRKCLQEDVFKKLDIIKTNFNKEWRTYPESIKKKVMIQTSIEFTYNTNAIEGSTITLHETEDIIQRKIAPHKSTIDIQETIQHSKTFLKIINQNKKISFPIILDWHTSLFSLTKEDIAGKIREYGVRVGTYKAPDWQDVPHLMNEFIEWFNMNEQHMHPIEFAARAHYKFEKIHPFGDGNGRLGRLLIAYTLKKNGFPLLIIEYKKRASYYKALSKDENYFLTYFIRRYLKQFKQYLE